MVEGIFVVIYVFFSIQFNNPNLLSNVDLFNLPIYLEKKGFIEFTIPHFDPY